MSLLFWKLLKTLLISVVVIVVLILNYLFFAWLLSVVPTTPNPTKGETYPLYVSTNGVHVDIILPVEYLPATWLSDLEIPVESRYLGIGWGDRGFYLNTPTWAELDWKVAFSAAFLPSSTLMHVTHYGHSSDRWYHTEIGKAELHELLAFVEGSFKRDPENGQLLLLEGKGYGQQDFFYEAEGYYTALYTCNVWANQALKRAAVKTAIWAPFESGITRHLSRVEGHS